MSNKCLWSGFEYLKIIPQARVVHELIANEETMLQWRVISIPKLCCALTFASTQIMFGKTSKPNVIHLRAEKQLKQKRVVEDVKNRPNQILILVDG